MEVSSVGLSPQKDLVKTLKKKAEEHYSSISKEFNAVEPTNYELVEKQNNEELRFPNFTLKLKDIPEAKNWKVGEKYKIELFVEQKGLRDRGEEDKNSEVDFAVLGVKTEKQDDKEDQDE